LPSPGRVPSAGQGRASPTPTQVPKGLELGIVPRHSSLVTRHLLWGSAVVGFFSLLSAVSGILVETSIAAQLGLSRNSDSFYVAFTIPYIITNLLSATSQFSLVPFFSTLDSRDSPQGLGRGVSYVVNLVFLGLGLFAAVGALGAPWLMRGIAPGFTRPQIELATQLSRWLFLIIVPAGIAETFRSFLLSRHSFVLSSAAGFIRNVVVIAVILWRFDRYGPFSIVLGYMAGTLAGGRMTRRLGVEWMVRNGGLVSAAGGVALLLSVLAFGASVPGILLPTVFYMLGTGLVLPNAMAGAIGPFPLLAGTAAALLGFIQMGAAALIGAAIGHLADGTARPMAAAIALCGLLQPLVHRLLIGPGGPPSVSR